MSHIVTIKTACKDLAAIRETCKRLSLPGPTIGTHRVFGVEHAGIGVMLPEWSYPIVINQTTGEIKYDNYGGAWGKQTHLDAFMQRYAVEKARIEARKKGHAFREEKLKDGSVKVTITPRS